MKIRIMSEIEDVNGNHYPKQIVRLITKHSDGLWIVQPSIPENSPELEVPERALSIPKPDDLRLVEAPSDLSLK